MTKKQNDLPPSTGRQPHNVLAHCTRSSRYCLVIFASYDPAHRSSTRGERTRYVFETVHERPPVMITDIDDGHDEWPTATTHRPVLVSFPKVHASSTGQQSPFFTDTGNVSRQRDLTPEHLYPNTRAPTSRTRLLHDAWIPRVLRAHVRKSTSGRACRSRPYAPVYACMYPPMSACSVARSCAGSA